MIELSYSTMNALIHEPHTFICKYVLDLDTFTTPYLQEGSRLHRIVQDHVSGRAAHPGLAHLPYFPHVEQRPFDPAMHVRLPIDDKFSFIGYVDGLNPRRSSFWRSRPAPAGASSGSSTSCSGSCTRPRSPPMPRWSW